ncbi:hypothetical protein ACIGXI_32660 [Kitasatospora aureofaciens]|uniref:hypothetical protein n=1 Tax=Kitasatospora aureofaciens TaxID=1894 RepID=UPI0037C9E257
MAEDGDEDRPELERVRPQAAQTRLLMRADPIAGPVEVLAGAPRLDAGQQDEVAVLVFLSEGRVESAG